MKKNPESISNTRVQRTRIQTAHNKLSPPKELRIGEKVYFSALDVTLDIMGGKWKALILWNLRGGAKRFTEFRKLIPDITEKMLSLQLKQLESDRIIEREVFAEVPPRVEYSLTEEGKTILPMLEAMEEWGKTKADKAATALYNLRNPSPQRRLRM